MRIKYFFYSIVSVLLSIILMCSLTLICVDAAENNTVTLTFNAYVENEIPQGCKISIGSSINKWNPRDLNWYATQLDSNNFQITVSIDNKYIGTEIEYKWTLQYPDESGNGWEHTENSAGSGSFGNRKYKVKEADNVINDIVVFPKEQQGSQSTVTCGKLEIIQMEMPQFEDGRKRTIRVWLPEGYDPSDKGKKYSVLYMHDGQNLFDASTSFIGEWQVDESVTKLMNQGYESTIVVGIDNGQLERFNELSPKWETSNLGKKYITAPAGDKYADFIVNTVKPYIDKHYNTKPQREYTGIGGSSMGGIMSLYMAMEYSDVFDYSIVFSPAMHVYSDNTLDEFFNNFNFNAMENLPKLYLFAGGKTGGSEVGSAYDEACITKYVDIIRNKLTEKSYPEMFIGTLVDKNEYHIESTWAKIFPIALNWLCEARKNQDDYYILGNVEMSDNEVDLNDGVLVQKYLAEACKFNAIQKKAGDINGNGEVELEDAVILQKYLAKVQTKFLIGEKLR